MTKNIYQDLKDKNVLIEKLTLIEKLASNGVSEDRIADILGFSKRYFKKLKEKNKDFTEVHDRGRGNFKQSRIDNIIKVAKGGSYADSGLTGRKLQCDSYRTVVPHRGGAFSGKDYTKVDRSGAYYSRYVAKALVKVELADEVMVSVVYAIGVPYLVAILLIIASNSKYTNDELRSIINKVFDFSPSSIIKEFKLKELDYRPLAE